MDWHKLWRWEARSSPPLGFRWMKSLPDVPPKWSLVVGRVVDWRLRASIRVLIPWRISMFEMLVWGVGCTVLIVAWGKWAVRSEWTFVGVEGAMPLHRLL